MTSFFVENDNLALSKYCAEFFPMERTARIMAYMHIHASVEFLYITSGEFCLTVGDVSYKATAGDLCLIRSNVTHQVTALSDVGHYYVMKLHPSFLFEAFPGDLRPFALAFLRNRPGAPAFFPSASLSEETHGLWQSLGREKPSDPLFPARVRALAADICIHLLRDNIPVSKEDEAVSSMSESNIALIYEVIHRIDNQYGAKLTPEDAAERIHISYSHFARLFREITGQTFKEYVSRVRLFHARNALLSTRRQVTEIAAECGYDNLSYFIAEYRKKYGVAPGADRKRNGKVEE